MTTTATIIEMTLFVGVFLLGLGIGVALKNVIDYYAAKNSLRYYEDPEVFAAYLARVKDDIGRSRKHLWMFGWSFGEWYWYKRFLSSQKNWSEPKSTQAKRI